MQFRNLLITFFALFSFGCAGAKYIDIEAAQPHAEIYIKKGEGQNLSAQIYEDAATCSGRSYLQENSNTPRWIRIPAGKPVTITLFDQGQDAADSGIRFGLGNTGGSSFCPYTLTFTPKVGKRYEASLSTGYMACRAALVDKKLQQAVDFEQREWSRGFAESTSWCDDVP